MSYLVKVVVAWRSHQGACCALQASNLMMLTLGAPKKLTKPLRQMSRKLVCHTPCACSVDICRSPLRSASMWFGSLSHVGQLCAPYLLNKESQSGDFALLAV